MADPGAASAAIGEVSFTDGVGDYIVLAGALAGHFRFRDIYTDGASLTYVVSNGAAVEIVTGVMTIGSGEDALSRDSVLLSSNSGNRVAWPTSGQRIVRPLLGAGLNVCTDAAHDGQVLVWQDALGQWCPDQRVIGPDADAGSGDPGSTVTIRAGAGDGFGLGGAVSITAGAGDSFNAGNVTINGGAATNGGGGGIAISAGDSDLGSGGHIVITSGDGQGASNITIQTGSDIGGDGGFCSVSAGESIGVDNTGQGGVLRLSAGGTTRDDGYGVGGDVNISGGGADGGNSGFGGAVNIQATNGDTGGIINLHPGSSHSDDGADVVIHLSDGAGSVGALRLIGTAADGSAPSGPTDSLTYRIFVDPADHKLKAIGESGTVTTLAVP